jgi:hypothetical protein
MMAQIVCSSEARLKHAQSPLIFHSLRHFQHEFQQLCWTGQRGAGSGINIHLEEYFDNTAVTGTVSG